MKASDMTSSDLVDELRSLLPSEMPGLDYAHELLAEISRRLVEHAEMRYEHYGRTGRWTP